MHMDFKVMASHQCRVDASYIVVEKSTCGVLEQAATCMFLHHFTCVYYLLMGSNEIETIVCRCTYLICRTMFISSLFEIINHLFF